MGLLYHKPQHHHVTTMSHVGTGAGHGALGQGQGLSLRPTPGTTSGRPGREPAGGLQTSGK